MQPSKLLVSFALLTTLILASCDQSSNSNTTSEPLPKPTPESEAADLFWQIKVADTSTLTIGAVESTTSIDIVAKNQSKGVIGHYAGSGSGQTFNNNSAYGSTSQAGTETALQWDFNIEYALAPLTDNEAAEIPDDLAPLVPSDDEAVAPLVTEDGKELIYEGAGSMSIGPRAATVTGGGTSTQKELNSQSFPTSINIYNDHTVKLELKTPQGSIYFDGELIGL